MLQGSVLLQVNEGPLEICRVFLGEPELPPSSHLRRLDAALREFLELCKKALLRNEQYMAPEQQAFQTELEQGFQTTSREVRKYLLREELLQDVGANNLPSAFVDDDEEGGGTAASSRAVSRRASIDLTTATPSRQSPLATMSAASEALLSPKLQAIADNRHADLDSSSESSTEINDDADDVASPLPPEHAGDSDNAKVTVVRRTSAPGVSAPTPVATSSGRKKKKRSGSKLKKATSEQ